MKTNRITAIIENKAVLFILIMVLFMSCKNSNSTLFEYKSTETYKVIYNDETIIF